MTTDLWLPKGYELANGSKIQSLLFSGNDWQIFDANDSNNILLTHPELTQKWNAMRLIDESIFEDITFGNKVFNSLVSHEKYMLVPVESGRAPNCKADALAFSFALKESRKLSVDASFHDAIYVEQFSRLLPTWTLTPTIEDKVVLGIWITGGVLISTDSFRRLTKLAGWMPANDLAEVIKASGLSVSPDAELLTGRKSNSQSKANEKTSLIAQHVEPTHQLSQQETLEHKAFSLTGRPQLEKFFNEHVIDIIFNAENYQAMGIEFPSAIILHGPPGCGKTYAVERLAEFINWPTYSINANSVGSPYIHETSKKISEVFDKAIDGAPSVIIIDEMESFLSDRRGGSSSGLHHIEEVAEFLRRIPEAIKCKVLIIAMTNMIDVIDPAILRRGRFDHIIEVGMPSRAEVASLLDSLLNKQPKAEALNMDKILDALTSKPLSDSAFVVREAARLAAKAGKLQLDQESIDKALRSLPDNKAKKSRRIGFV